MRYNKSSFALKALFLEVYGANSNDVNVCRNGKYNGQGRGSRAERFQSPAALFSKSFPSTTLCHCLAERPDKCNRTALKVDSLLAGNILPMLPGSIRVFPASSYTAGNRLCTAKFGDFLNFDSARRSS